MQLSAEGLYKAAYFNTINYTPHPAQMLYHNSTARFRFANCGRRFGKAEYIENLIPMFNGGFKRMADVQAGDLVIGPDGMPAKVLGTTDIMHGQECARVEFNDGAHVVVSKDHLWTVVDKAARKALVDARRIYRERTLHTYDMQATVKTTSGESNYAIHLTKPVQYAKRELKVDAYLLGAWIGDGSASGNIITTADAQTLDELTKLGLKYKYRSQHDYYVYGLRNILEAYYLFNYVNAERTSKSLVGEKYIPEDYLYSSVDDRLALLQGLMDTDGTISKNGHCEFSTSIEHLANQVAQLVTSLGMKVNIYSRITTYIYRNQKQNGKVTYRVVFQPKLNVFRLTRKLERIKPSTVNYRFITNIVDVASVPVKCIKVDREDGLYLTSTDYIITHNTFMAARDLEPKLLKPNKHYWIVGPTYDLAEKEFRVIWQDMIIKLQLGKDKSVQKVYNKRQGDMFIKFTDRNTLLEVRSAQNPENLVGESLDGVIMSEAAKHTKETWERYIRPALSDRKGSADFTTTPEGFNWLYDEWMHGKDDTMPEYESWKFPSWLNTFAFPGGATDAEIALLKRTMTPEAFTQEIEADFGSFVGKIFPEWNVSQHVQPHSFNPAWPNYIAFDFGYTNPLAAVEFQVSPDDQIYIWREHYKSYTMLEEHVRQLKSREQPHGYHITMCFGDAADPEAVQYLNAHFAPTTANPNAKTNWRDGIDLIRSFMERDGGEDEFGGAKDPIPALHVDPSCLNVIREFNNYKAPSNSKGHNVTELGIKADDHAIDAIRYALVHIFRLGAIYRLGDGPANHAIMNAVANKAIVQQGQMQDITQAQTATPANQQLTVVGAVMQSAISSLSYEVDSSAGYFTSNISF